MDKYSGRSPSGVFLSKALPEKDVCVRNLAIASQSCCLGRIQFHRHGPRNGRWPMPGPENTARWLRVSTFWKFYSVCSAQSGLEGPLLEIAGLGLKVHNQTVRRLKIFQDSYLSGLNSFTLAYGWGKVLTNYWIEDIFATTFENPVALKTGTHYQIYFHSTQRA